MKQRREVQNNDGNIEVLFTRSLLEGTGGMEESAVLRLSLVHLWPRLLLHSTVNSYPVLHHSYWRAVRAVKSM